MTIEEFDKIVDESLEVSFDADVEVRPTLDTEFDPHSYYRVNGVGLWRAARVTGGIALSRLFFGDKEYRSFSDWARDIKIGRIRQIK